MDVYRLGTVQYINTQRGGKDNPPMNSKMKNKRYSLPLQVLLQHYTVPAASLRVSLLCFLHDITFGTQTL